jgi:hypothetical protein
MPNINNNKNNNSQDFQFNKEISLEFINQPIEDNIFTNYNLKIFMNHENSLFNCELYLDDQLTISESFINLCEKN